MMQENLEGPPVSARARKLMARRLPDPALCRVYEVGRGFYDCLVEQPHSCPHAISFADGHVCRHPEASKLPQGER